MDDNLATVLRLFTIHEVDSLPVVEQQDSRKLLGMVRRRDVIMSYYEKLGHLKVDHHDM
jgi:CBS domain-containing protein